MQYFAAFISSDLVNDSITVSVPGLGLKLTGLKVTHIKGIDYGYNEYSTFNVDVSDANLKKIRDLNLKEVDAGSYNITGSEHKQPVQIIDNKTLKPILQMSAGIGDTFIAEMTKCAGNLLDYFNSIVNQANKLPGAKGKIPTLPTDELKKKLESSIRISAASVSQATFGSKSAVEKPAINLSDSESSATVHGSAGTGFHTDKRGVSSQGQMTFSEASHKAPMSIIGVDAQDMPGRDILPQGTVLTPHVRKLPDIMGYISLGIGVMNIFNVIRALWDIDAQWMKDADNGFKKVEDGAFNMLKELNGRVNAGLDARAAAVKANQKSTIEKVLDITAKLREDIEKEKEKQAEKEKATKSAQKLMLAQVKKAAIDNAVAAARAAGASEEKIAEMQASANKSGGLLG